MSDQNQKDAENGRRKRLRAASLRYDRNQDAAPRMTAHGEGRLAERIIELAMEHNVPITRDPDLLSLLSHVEVGSSIPPKLYEIVAELLVFIYRLKERYVEMNDSDRAGRDSEGRR